MEHSTPDLEGPSVSAMAAEEHNPVITAIVVIALVAVLTATWWFFIRHDLQIKAPAGNITNAPTQVGNS